MITMNRKNAWLIQSFPPSRLSLLSPSLELPLFRETKFSVPAPLIGRIVSKCCRADNLTVSCHQAAIAAIFKHLLRK